MILQFEFRRKSLGGLKTPAFFGGKCKEIFVIEKINAKEGKFK
jgi:hypothetical protein